MNVYDLIISDFDGTLINSMPGLTELAVIIINRYYDIPRNEARKAYLDTVGIPFPDQLRIIAKQFGFTRYDQIPRDDIFVKATNDYESRKVDLTICSKMFNGAKTFLGFAKANGIKVAVVSSTRKYLLSQALNHHDVNHLFDRIGGLELAWNKEAQTSASIVKFNATPDRVLYLGDSPEDKRIAELFDIDFRKIDSEEDWDVLLSQFATLVGVIV